MSKNPRCDQATQRRIITIIVIIICFILEIYLVYTLLPVHVDWVRDGPPQVGVDWKGAFRPAAIELIKGNSPYTIPAFFNPPWTLLPFLPIALLSPALGSAVMYVLNIYAYIFVALKLRMNIILIAVFCLLSGMIINSNNGNIEGIVALGFVLPPQIGLFFILSKPQMGIAVAVFWAVETWRIGGFPNLIRVFTPVLAAFIVSFLIFGFWINNLLPVDEWWNTSIFPKGVPVGLLLLGISLWKREIKYAIAASPFFAPYLTVHTWAVVWLGLLSFFPKNLWFKFRHHLLPNS